MSKQKITRVCLVAPVNAPGKHDSNLRHIEAGKWTIGVDFALGATLTDEDGRRMFVPMSNISSIDYE
jgi:hypothetical protein